MKILFVSGLRILKDASNVYHHHCFNDFVNLYESFDAEFEYCLCKRDVIESELPIVGNGLKIHFLKEMNSLNELWKNFQYNKTTISESLNGVDLLITHLPSFHGDLAVSLARKQGIPILSVGVACPWDSLFNHSIKGKIVAPLEYFLTKSSFKKSNYAIYVTQKFLQSRYPSNCYSIGCSDVNIVNRLPENLDARLKKIESDEITFCICTIGNLGVKYKRQEDVIKAVSLLKQEGLSVDYYLIGGGDKLYLLDVARKNGVENLVHFEGNIPHEEVFKLLMKMDVYIQPSQQEGLPRALVEAMSCGLPAIGSTVGGIPELLEQRFLIKPKDVKRLASLIKEFHDNRGLQIEAAKKNFLKAMEYTPEELKKRRDDYIAYIINDLKKGKK